MGVIMGFGACWMNMYVIMSCKFANITEINPVTGDPIEITKRGYGLIAREIAYGDIESYRGCVMYPDDEKEYLFDFWIKMARQFAFLGGILGLITFTCLIGSYCFLCDSWNFERWLLWTSIWAAICMAMTNMIFGNSFCKDNICKVSYGTGYAISAFMTYLMLANQVKSMGQPPPRNDMPPPGGREDDLWYDHEDERFMGDDDDDDDKDGDDWDTFEDEMEGDNDERPPNRPWRRRRRRRPRRTDEQGTFVNDHDAYDDMQEYMSPEDQYAPPQDEDFLQKDKEHQQRLFQEQSHNQPQPMPNHHTQQQQQPSSSSPPYEPPQEPLTRPNPLEDTSRGGEDVGGSMQQEQEQKQEHHPPPHRHRPGEPGGLGTTYEEENEDMSNVDMDDGYDLGDRRFA